MKSADIGLALDQALGRAWAGAAVEAGIWAGPHSDRVGAGPGRAGLG